MKEMTIEEAAEYLKVTPQTIRNYITKSLLAPKFGPLGKGPGKPVRVLAEDVINFFSRKSDGSPATNQPAK